MMTTSEFAVDKQPGVGCDLATQELHLHAAVEIEPQTPLLTVTHWVPLSLWHVERENPPFQGLSANRVPKRSDLFGKCGLMGSAEAVAGCRVLPGFP